MHGKFFHAGFVAIELACLQVEVWPAILLMELYKPILPLSASYRRLSQRESTFCIGAPVAPFRKTHIVITSLHLLIFW